ncbi:MAG: hypothetical protein J5864_06985 [Oscillospiraceae bacterium]|nr:hypothetical protein [Oscillospiraceae bacterium]
MKKRTMFWQLLDKLEGEEYLDAAGKALLSYKVISANILKACIPELSHLSVKEIADECIIGEPEVSSVSVHRDSADCTEKPEKINQSGNEDTDVDEGTVKYDIRFVVHIPGEEEYTKVYINLEAQNKLDPGYPLVKRGLYYDARMLSAQHGVEFEESDYGKIKKVYSIWICINPKKEYQNSINRYHINESNVLGNVKLPVKDYDVMETILVCLHTNGDKGKCGNKLVDMLSLIFDKNKASKEKQDELEKEYEITMTKEYNEVVDRMCDISGYYTEDYYAAKAELAAKDEILASKDEELEKKNRIIAEMMINNGKPADEIEGYTGLSVNSLKQIAKSLGKPLVM